MNIIMNVSHCQHLFSLHNFILYDTMRFVIMSQCSFKEDETEWVMD